jgi:hypothetical protein
MPDEIMICVYEHVSFEQIVAHRNVSQRWNTELPWAVRHVQLSNRGLDMVDAARLATFVNTYKNTIESLDVSHNDVGGHGASALSTALAGCPRLSSVDMRYNSLEPAVCQAVAATVRARGPRRKPLVNQFEYLCSECDYQLAEEDDFRSDGTYGHGLLAKFFYRLNVDIRGQPYEQTLSSGKYSLRSDIHCPCCGVDIGGWK